MVTTALSAASVPALNSGITLLITSTESAGSAPLIDQHKSKIQLEFYNNNAHLCYDGMKDHAGSLRTINGRGIILCNLDGVSTQRLHISCIMQHGDHWYCHAQPLPVCSAVSAGRVTSHIILEEVFNV